MAILQGDQAYFFNGTTGFVPYTGGLAALLSNSRTEAPSVRSITNTTETISLTGDASGVMGGQVYIGYGATFGELINNARYKNVYNVSVPAAITASNYSSNVVNTIMQVPIVFPVETPGGSQLSPTGHYGRYGNFGMGGAARGDLRGTGMDDVIVAPHSAPLFLPFSKMEFWVNNGDGTFTNKADQLIVGGAPAVAPGQTFVADFNGDGIKDILHMDSPEYGQCTSAANIYLCQQGGKFIYLQGLSNGTWVDKSNQLPAPLGGNSGVTASSSNGDGVRDLLFDTNGLRLYKNDGNGNFSDQTYRLPLELRGFSTGQQRWQTTGGTYQTGMGGATFANVAGQAKPMLVTASYGPDLYGQAPQSTDRSTIRFFTQNSDGTFAKAQTIVMPQDVSDTCGAYQAKAADFTRTGTDDVLVFWEKKAWGNADLPICHTMLFRNTGANGQINYVDVTETSIPQWRSVFAYTTPYGFVGANEFDFADVDNNGTLDMAFAGQRWGSNVLVQATPFLYNDGNGNFSTRPFKINGATPTSDAIAALMGENAQMTWANTVMALRLKPNQPYGMLFVETGHDGDQTTTPYIVDKQIRLHAVFPQ
jgi:hypothetical protein